MLAKQTLAYAWGEAWSLIGSPSVTLFCHHESPASLPSSSRLQLGFSHELLGSRVRLRSLLLQPCTLTALLLLVRILSLGWPGQ